MTSKSKGNDPGLTVCEAERRAKRPKRSGTSDSVEHEEESSDENNGQSNTQENNGDERAAHYGIKRGSLNGRQRHKADKSSARSLRQRVDTGAAAQPQQEQRVQSDPQQIAETRPWWKIEPFGWLYGINISPPENRLPTCNETTPRELQQFKREGTFWRDMSQGVHGSTEQAVNDTGDTQNDTMCEPCGPELSDQPPVMVESSSSDDDSARGFNPLVKRTKPWLAKRK